MRDAADRICHLLHIYFFDINLLDKGDADGHFKDHAVA